MNLLKITFFSLEGGYFYMENLFEVMQFVPISNFQSCLYIFLSSWVEPVLNRGLSVLLKNKLQCLCF